jgi:hypothetical protein
MSWVFGLTKPDPGYGELNATVLTLPDPGYGELKQQNSTNPWMSWALALT